MSRLTLYLAENKLFALDSCDFAEALPLPDRPTFEAPPLVEVVCQIQFQPLTKLQAPYLGFFWQKIRTDFPRCHSVPPLSNSIEMPGNQPAQMTVQLGNMPELPRIWFIDDQDVCLVQVQQDRFIFNWKRTPKSDVPYPRYPKIIERFKHLYGTFKEFLSEYELGEIAPVMNELTYVNHIMPGREIQTLGDIGNVLPDLSWRNSLPNRFLPSPSRLNFRAQFPMDGGEVVVNLVTGRRKEEEDKTFFRLDITARGAAPKSDHWKWFDQANTWIVEAFVDLTSDEAQLLWKRTDERA